MHRRTRRVSSLAAFALVTIVAVLANFCFGILANFGVGNYAPTLVMFSLMGMDPRLAFPIMAGGAALMGAGSSFQHVRIGEVDLKVVLGLAIGGIPAVFVAVFIVKSMPLDYLRWLVVIVVLYAAAVMARCDGDYATNLPVAGSTAQGRNAEKSTLRPSGVQRGKLCPPAGDPRRVAARIPDPSAPTSQMVVSGMPSVPGGR